MSHTRFKKELDREALESLDLEGREKIAPYAAMHIADLCDMGEAGAALALVEVKGTATDPEGQFSDNLLVVHIVRMDDDGKTTSMPFNPDGPEMQTKKWLSQSGLDDGVLEKKYMTLPYSAVPTIRNYPHLFTKFSNSSSMSVNSSLPRSHI